MKYIVLFFCFNAVIACTSTDKLVDKLLKLPKPIGHYSYATEHKDLIFVSGQIGIDPLTNTLKTGIEEQTIQIFKNLRIILKNNNSDLNYVKKTTIYITDINQYERVNLIYSNYFGSSFPARTTIVVVSLPKSASIEIECIAVKKNNKVN